MKLVAADAIPNVLRAIHDFPENEWVQYTAIQVLQNAANIGRARIVFHLNLVRQNVLL